MSNAVTEPKPRAPESKPPSVSESGDPPEVAERPDLASSEPEQPVCKRDHLYIDNAYRLRTFAERLEGIKDFVGSIIHLTHPYTEAVTEGCMDPCLPQCHTATVERTIYTVIAEMSELVSVIEAEGESTTALAELGNALAKDVLVFDRTLGRLTLYKTEEVTAVLAMLNAYLDQRAVERRRIDKLIANWEPAEAPSAPGHHAGSGDESPATTADLGDIPERVLRIAGLVRAAVLTEASLTNNGPGNLYGDPSDYFTAVVGTIRAANSELNDLLKLLDGAPEPLAEGAGAT